MIRYSMLVRTDMKSERWTELSSTELKYFHLCCNTHTHFSKVNLASCLSCCD